MANKEKWINIPIKRDVINKPINFYVNGRLVERIGKYKIINWFYRMKYRLVNWFYDNGVS